MKRMRRIAGTTGFCASLMMCATGACAEEPSKSALSDLKGPTWQLVQFQSGDGKTLVPENENQYTVAFSADGSAAVRMDCNRGHGTWKSAQRNQLELGPLALTRMACPPSPLNERLPKDWEYVRSYVIKDGHLFLALMADGGTYEFKPQSSQGKDTAPSSGSSETALENTHWKLTRLGTTAVTTASNQQVPYIELKSQLRRVSGTGGCNRLTGSYQLNGNRLVFAQMVATMMACIAGMETEQAFLDALNHVDHWKITGHTLELYDAHGTSLASFAAQDVR
jgi:heat shock protein HslJ